MISIEWLSLHHEEGAKVKAGGSKKQGFKKRDSRFFTNFFDSFQKKKMLVKADPHFEKWWEWNGRKKL